MSTKSHVVGVSVGLQTDLCKRKSIVTKHFTTPTTASSLLQTTTVTTSAPNTNHGPRDVNDDVSWATGRFFFNIIGFFY
jgi:hypothetical protein